MNVFVLTTGRSGSVTFAEACRHITNYTTGHETRVGLVGADRLAYPDDHIEVDDRLAWLLGRLEDAYGDRAFYVHLRRDEQATAASRMRRWNKPLMRAYRNGILWDVSPDVSRLDVALDLNRTVTATSSSSCATRARSCASTSRRRAQTFPEFWKRIGAQGDLEAALEELHLHHHAGTERRPTPRPGARSRRLAGAHPGAPAPPRPDVGGRPHGQPALWNASGAPSSVGPWASSRTPTTPWPTPWTTPATRASSARRPSPGRSWATPPASSAASAPCSSRQPTRRWWPAWPTTRRYREDPLGRLSRTSAYVTATSYGAMPEVEQAVRIVRAAHRRVKGVSHRGIPYRADDPPLAAWVHNSLTDSFLVCNQVYGARPLSTEEADRFVREQARIGRLLDAEALPETAAELSRWIAEHPAVAPSPGMREAVDFLRDPPLDPAVKVAYQVLASAAVATIPPRIRHVAGPEAASWRRRTWATPRWPAMRWALGASPRWRQALLRVGAPVPEHRFKQKRPFETLEQR